MKSSEALKRARNLIASGKIEFVCHALENVWGANTKVYRRIQSCLCGGTVTTWLYQKSEDFRRFGVFASVAEYTKAVREYRLAWIDWMIPQYEAVGD